MNSHELVQSHTQADVGRAVVFVRVGGVVGLPAIMSVIAAALLFLLVIHLVFLVVVAGVAILHVGLPLLVVALSIFRWRAVPLYWIVSIGSLFLLPIAFFLIGPPRNELFGIEDVFERRGEVFYWVESTLKSWVFVSVISGSLITLVLSFLRSPWAGALSGLSWGLFGVAVTSILLWTV